MTNPDMTEKTGLRAWLLTDTPTSRRHARLSALYVLWLSLRGNVMTMFGISVLLLLVLSAVFAPLIAPHDPFAQTLTDRLLPPLSDGYLLGTDTLGRDILSRIIWGARETLMIVAIIAVIAPVVGLFVGTLAGYAGGIVDTIMMRVTDIFLAFPRLVLALAFASALGPGLFNAILAITLTAWAPYARMARAETLTIRSSDYIAAVRLQGAGGIRILTKHIWPLCTSSLIVRVTLDMAGIVLTAAGLGFLGLGAQPPSPEWGAMTSYGREVFLSSWWVAIMPGMAIFTVSLAFNLLGDGLRDVLDPKDGSQ